MDFGTLLHQAQRNEHSAKKEEVRCYKTTFAPPKKEQVKSKNLSANIQKFLARKEEEEKRKAAEAKKKRDELLALRSQDGKAKKRVAAMLKRTKAANKAVIEDAVDNNDTAITIGGLAQPDEDDYGYVSQEASALYNKIMEKYNSMPTDEPKNNRKPVLKSSAADLINTKDRVRMALLREEEEEMMPHKRKRKTKEEKLKESEGGSSNQLDNEDMREQDEEKPPEKPSKPRRPAPPPMDFYSLLKLAEKKQFEPIKFEPKVKDEDEDERPMTKKQRAEWEREREWRMRREGKLPPLSASQQGPSKEQKNRSQLANDKGKERKNSHLLEPGKDQRNNKPSIDQRNNRPSIDGYREQLTNKSSKYNRFVGDNREREFRPSGDSFRERDNQSSGDAYRERERSLTDGYRERERPSTDGYRERERPSTDGYRERERPIDGYRDRERPSADGYRERERPSADGYRERERPSTDTYRDRERSSADGYRDRERPSADGYRERERPSADGYRERERPSPDGYRERERSSANGYRERERPSADGYRERERPSADGYRERERPSADGYRERERPSTEDYRERERPLADNYRDREKFSGDRERSNRPPGEAFRDQKNRFSEGNRDQKINRTSEGNTNISKIPKLNSSNREERDEKPLNRIPKLNGTNSNKAKLQGNSVSKVGKDRCRDDDRNSGYSEKSLDRNKDSVRSSSFTTKTVERNRSDVKNESINGRPPVKNIQKPSTSASGQSSVNKISIEHRKVPSITGGGSSKSTGDKNPNLSSYSKKLQESLLAKLQEKERKSGSPSESKFRTPGAPVSKQKLREMDLFESRDSETPSKSAKNDPKDNIRKEISTNRNPAKPLSSSQKSNGTIPSKSQVPLQKGKLGNTDMRDRKLAQMSSKDIKPKQFPPPDVKPRQFPPPDMKPKQFPPPDVRPRQFPPGDVRRKPKPQLKRRIVDSDDEYDSELDDFIDDGPEEEEDYSKHIREIFGYDKSRYANIDDDDECMESSFSQQLKEEFVSTKMGILEDLEDIAMEKRQMERKKKQMIMKKKRRL